jgi:hypothetical protein
MAGGGEKVKGGGQRYQRAARLPPQPTSTYPRRDVVHNHHLKVTLARVAGCIAGLASHLPSS